MGIIKKLVKCISYIEKLNIDEIEKLKIGIEIQDFTEPNLKKSEIKKIVETYKKILQDFNGIKALHGPFLDLKPASPDLLIRDISYKRYLDALNIARELNTDYIIFHSQINPYLNNITLRRLNNSQAKELWDKILSETDYRGIILIENIFEESPLMLKEYIKEINKPNVKINLDIGHAKFGKVDLEEWIIELKDYIEYMHIHSNDSLYDTHEKPSNEEISNLYDLLEKYKLNPVLSLEYDTDNLTDEIKRYQY